MGVPLMFVCIYCGTSVDPTARTTWQRVIGWQRMAGVRASGKHGGSDIALREAVNEWACPTCIVRVRNGVDVGQGSLL
jgi:hypothetical protein